MHEGSPDGQITLGLHKSNWAAYCEQPHHVPGDTCNSCDHKQAAGKAAEVIYNLPRMCTGVRTAVFIWPYACCNCAQVGGRPADRLRLDKRVHACARGVRLCTLVDTVCMHEHSGRGVICRSEL